MKNKTSGQVGKVLLLIWIEFLGRPPPALEYLFSPVQSNVLVNINHTLVVVATNAVDWHTLKLRWPKTQQIDTLFWLRPVADEVAEAPDRIWARMFALGMPKDCLKRLEISVNIGEYQKGRHRSSGFPAQGCIKMTHPWAT